MKEYSMKKQFLLACGLACGLTLSAKVPFTPGQNGLDGDFFLDPHVSSVADSVSAISINIGSELPSTTHIAAEKACREIGLSAHFKEIASTISAEEKAVIAVPASYGVVFTDGSANDESVMAHIQEVLAKIESVQESEKIKSVLNELTEVYRATFAIRNERLCLVTDEKELHLGESIWRKSPEGAELAVYHSEEEYLMALFNAGFAVDEVKRPCFYGNLKYRMHRSSLKEGEKGLGQSYVENHPFTVFYITKKA
jgi:hypothetical protein